MKRTGIVLLAAIALSLAACRHGGPRPIRPAVDPELTKLSKEQLFDRGEDQFAKKRYARARTYYSYIYENHPNDPLGRRALLRVADTYYAQGDPVNLVEAQYKYRDFINRYPGSDRADYAMLQIAMVAYKQMEKPDRDQQKTREAVEKFNDMIHTFPNSALRPEADKRLQDALDRLARHEHIVARFQIIDGPLSRALEGNAENALGQLEMLWIPRGHKMKEGVNGRAKPGHDVEGMVQRDRNALSPRVRRDRSRWRDQLIEQR